MNTLPKMNEISALPQDFEIGMKYRVIKELSRNDVFIFYEAFDEKRDQKCMIAEFCPIKVIDIRQDGKLIYFANKIGEEEFVQLKNNLNIEATVHLNLGKFKGIAPIIDTIEANNTVYIVYDLKDCSPILQMTEAGILFDYIKLKTGIKDMLLSFSKLHDKHIYHTAVSPECIFMDGVNNIYLAGFCESVCLHNGGCLLRKQSVYAGLNDYSEQNDTNYEIADVYSLSVVLYRLLGGIEPKREGVVRHEINTILPLTKLNTTVPSEVSKAIINAITATKYAAFSLSEFNEALYEEIAVSTLNIKKRIEKKEKLLAAGVLVLLIGIALTIYSMANGGSNIKSDINRQEDTHYVHMPNLIRLSVGKAGKIMYDLGIETKLRIVRKFDGTLPEDTVLVQEPAFGTIINADTIIKVVISSEQIPPMRGETVSDAKMLLENAGYTVKIKWINSSYDFGLVCNQIPEAGTKVLKDKIVTIFVSLGIQDGGIHIEPGTLMLNDTAEFMTFVIPLNANNRNIIRISTDESIVSIRHGIKPQKEGKEFAASYDKEGTADIVVKTEDGNFSAVCKVTKKQRICPISRYTCA